MIESSINLLAVVVAAIVQMIVGSVWYSPKVFGKISMHAAGVSEADMERAKRAGMWRAYLGMFIGCLIISYVLAVILRLAEATTALEGATVGFIVWLGFVATTSLGEVLFAGRPKNLYLIHNGHFLVNFIISGVILALWQ